jgi:TRAP-type C4-dicarboxylate transport system permease small subunit
MGKIVEGYFHLLKLATVLCLALMVTLVFGNVVLRYGFNTGITVSEELSRWLFVYVTFLGAIVAMREHAHLGVDSLVKRLPPIGKKICLVVSQLLMLFATWLFLQGSWVQTNINLHNAAPASGMSVGIVYAAGIIFSISVGFILLADLYRVVSGKASEKDLVMVRESEEHEQLEVLQKELARGSSDGRTAPPKNC